MIKLDHYLKQAKSILCLNGTIPQKVFFQNFAHLPLIATDGAADKLCDIGVIPDLIAGDLDSTQPHQYPETIETICTPDQNLTDFEKALDLLKKRGQLPAIICGTQGGELDHTLYNLYILERLSRTSPTLFFNTEEDGSQKIGIFITQNLELSLAKNSLISLLPFPKTTVTTRGLQWDLTNEQLNHKRKSSVRNRTRNSLVTIEITHGTLLLICADGLF